MIESADWRRHNCRRGRSNAAAGYTAAALAVEPLIAAVPQTQSFVEVRGVQVSSQVLLKLSLMQSADPKMVQEFFNRP